MKGTGARLQKGLESNVVTEPAASQRVATGRPKPVNVGGSATGSGSSHSRRGAITSPW